MGAAQQLESSEQDSEVLPRKFDRYDLLKKLATGGMAEIYLAKQSGLEGFEKVVVLKRILSHLAQDDEFVSMFLDEARIAAKLSHPNVVQIYDLGRADGTYYIAMEYVAGRNIQHMITKHQEMGGLIPVEHVCRIIAGVCDGLHYAHSRKDYDGRPLNIIHRDISPQNILVSFAGGVKVVDFGIAKASTQIAQTRAGVLKGKYSYMSPEQVRGPKIDHRSDLFALGLVFYEMLTGARAFERDSSLKTLKAIVQDKPVNPKDLNPEIPMEVVKLLSKALEKNPDKRYKTAQEMQLAIEDYLESSPKKSNNVRLSRYMYELFDDELNSVDGTMLVDGVGEVVIPAAQGAKFKPRIEDDVDQNTLSAALLPAEPAERGSERSDRAERSRSDPRPSSGAARNAGPERSSSALRAPPRGVTRPIPDPDESFAADTESNNKAAVPPLPAAAPGVPPLEPSRSSQRGAKAGQHHQQQPRPASSLPDEEPFVGPRTDEVRAVGSSASATVQQSATEADPLAPQPSLVVGPNGPINLKDAVRPAARSQPAALAGAGSMGLGASSSAAVIAASPLAQTSGPASAGRAAIAAASPVLAPADKGQGNPPQAGQGQQSAPSMRPNARPGGLAGADAGGLPAVMSRIVPGAVLPARLPPAFWVALAAILGVFTLALAGLVALIMTLGTVEYGLVLVTTDPPNARVYIDGEDVGASPVQAPVRLGQGLSVSAVLPGYETAPPVAVEKLDTTVLELAPIVLQKSQ